MALQSKLLGGDSKLEAAAVSDPAHVTPGTSGPHVAKIQQALILVDGAAIDQDGKYGPRTAAAVSAFKRARSILNFAGKIDDIVGKKTIAALDQEMLLKERSGGGGGGGGAIPGGGRKGIVGSDVNPNLQSVPLTVVPFNEPPNSFILAKSIDFPNGPQGNKNDLDTGDPPKPPLTSREQLVVDSLTTPRRAPGQPGKFTFSTSDLRGMVMDELALSNQGDGILLARTFFNNNDPNFVLKLDVGSNISDRVRDSDALAEETKGINKDIDDALQAQFLTGTIDYRLMRGFGPQPKVGVALANPAGVKDPPAVGFGLREFRLAALIGSFQAATLILKSFSVDTQRLTYDATLRFELIDHFGVDNGDVLGPLPHGTPGQVAFWILQHKHRPGHIPYRVQVICEKRIVGSLLNPNLFPGR